jgi:hypothetical protein
MEKETKQTELQVKDPGKQKKSVIFGNSPDPKIKKKSDQFDNHKSVLFHGLGRIVKNAEEDRAKEELKEIKAKNRRDNQDMILFIISTALFLIGVFQQFDITKDHYITNSLRSYYGFNQDEQYKLILSEDIKKFFFDQIFYKSISSEFYFWDKKYQIISNVRLTGRRPILNNNSTTILREYEYLSYFYNIDNDQSQSNAEETAPYTNGGYTFTYSKDDSYRNLGGYVVSYSNKDVFKYETVEGSSIQKKIEDRVFTDQQTVLLADKIDKYFNRTTTLTIDFVVSNMELSYVIPIIFKYVYSKTGISKLYLDVNVMQKDLYERRSQYFRGAVEILYLIIVLIYLFFLLRGFRKQFNKKAFKYFGKKDDPHKKEENIKLDNINQEVIDEKIENPSISNRTRHAKKTRLYIIKNLVYKNLLDSLHIISLIISVVSIILWIINVIYLYYKRSSLDYAITISDKLLSFDLMNHYLFTADALRNYKVLTAFNVLFYFIRFIKILANYVTTTDIFLDTIKVAFSDLFSFFILFLNFLLALTIHNFFYYGRYLPDFDVFAKVIQQNISFILGTADPTTSASMYALDSTITLIYFLLVIILIRYQILILLMATILYYFKSSVDNFYSQKKDITGQDLTVEQIIKKSPKDPVNELLKKFRRLIICSFCKKKKSHEIQLVADANSLPGSPQFRRRKSSFVISIEQRRDTRASITKQRKHAIKNLNRDDNKTKSHGINLDYKLTGKDLLLFNSEFTENFAITLRNPYFDSQNDFIKLKYYYESKYRTSFIGAIIYLLFLGTLVITFLFNDQTPWRNTITKALEDRFSENFDFYNAELNTTQSHNFFNLNNSAAVRQYLFSEFPKYFGQTDLRLATLLETNVVIKGSYLITVRKARLNPQYDPNDSVRLYLELDKYNPVKYENITWLDLTINEKKKNIFYNQTESYRNVGGYTLRYDLLNPPFIPEESQLTYLDSTFTFATVEFFMENPEYQMLIYVEAFITQDYGTNYKNYFNSYIISYNHVRDGYIVDYIKVISEISLFFLTIYMIIHYLKDLVNRVNQYDKWYKEQIMKLSDKSKELRNILRPEILRKMGYVLDVHAYYDLILICLSVYYLSLIITRVSYRISQGSAYQSQIKTNTIWNLRTDIYQIIDVESMFDVVGSVLIFLASVKLLIMLNFGKYFGLLIRTMKESTVLNINFVAIVLLIQPAFVTFAYFMFGTRASDYSTLADSAMSSLNVIFGFTDYTVFYNSDSKIGPFYFFLYIFVVRMILINLFLALIYTAYTKVKEKIRHTVEIYSLKRTYLFCCYKKKEHKKLNNKGEIETTFELANLPVKLF